MQCDQSDVGGDETGERSRDSAGGVALSTLCEICISKISDYSTLQPSAGNCSLFSIFIKLYVDDGGTFAAFSARALAASMTHFYATAS